MPLLFSPKGALIWARRAPEFFVPAGRCKYLVILRPHLGGGWRAQISRRFAFYLWANRDSLCGDGEKKRVLNSHIYPLFPSQPCRLVVARVAGTIFNFIAAIGKVSQNSPVA